MNKLITSQLLLASQFITFLCSIVKILCWLIHILFVSFVAEKVCSGRHFLHGGKLENNWVVYRLKAVQYGVSRNKIVILILTKCVFCYLYIHWIILSCRKKDFQNFGRGTNNIKNTKEIPKIIWNQDNKMKVWQLQASVSQWDFWHPYWPLVFLSYVIYDMSYMKQMSNFSNYDRNIHICQK